jgi:hypothetical protein
VDAVVALSAVILIGVLGWSLLRRRVGSITEERASAGEFANNLVAYLESRGRDLEKYYWLLHRSVPMQSQMGRHGIIAEFHAPFGMFTKRNYPVLLNAIPSVHQSLTGGMPGQAQQYGQMAHEALVRYCGVLDDRLQRAKAEAKNPVVAFRQGVQAVLSAPRSLLSWLGLVSPPNPYSRRPLARIGSGLVALLSLAAAVITVVVGWGSFLEIVRGWWSTFSS